MNADTLLMLRPSGDARIGNMLSRVLRNTSPEVSQAVATRMGMAKAMASNNSVPATGIQKFGDRAGSRLGFNTEPWCLIGHLKLAARHAYVTNVPLVRAREKALLDLRASKLGNVSEQAPLTTKRYLICL
jgi:ubiquinone biosynthesis protein UbiJ